MKSITSRGFAFLLLTLIPIVLGISGAALCAANVMTAPKVSTAPDIDGQLDSVWSEAVLAGSYVSSWELNTGGTPGVETEAWVLWDDKNLYVAFRNYQDMSAVKAAVTEDEGPAWNDDDNEIFVAPDWPEPRPYYQFVTNPNGVRSDNRALDFTWNGEWKVAVAKTGDAWVTEVAIPWTTLGKVPKAGDELGFNITRRWDAGDQWITWTPGLVSFHTPEGFSTLKLVVPSGELVSLAKNPSFEESGEGVPGWGRWKKGEAEKVFSVTEEAAHSGSRSLKYSNSDPNWYGLCFQNMDAQPGAKYRATAWIKTKGLVGGTARITLELYSKDDQYLSGSPCTGISGDSDWVQVTTETPVVPENATTLTVICYVDQGGTGTVYYDDVVVEKIQ